ncbi:MAG: transposase [Anaerolineales bacterium]|nr:transposase [Anaerolineales bacterium]
MEKKRRHHSAEFKTKVALEAIKEQKTLSQICEQYSLHANQISDWKKTIVEQSVQLFERSGEKKKENSMDIESLQAPYLEQIGLLQMEVSFLKKKLKQLGQI